MVQEEGLQLRNKSL